MVKSVLKGLWLWLKGLIWAVLFSLPFIFVSFYHSLPEQERPGWVWVEEADPGGAEVIIVLIGAGWLFSGLIFVVGNVLVELMEGHLAEEEESGIASLVGHNYEVEEQRRRFQSLSMDDA